MGPITFLRRQRNVVRLHQTRTSHAKAPVLHHNPVAPLDKTTCSPLSSGTQKRAISGNMAISTFGWHDAVLVLLTLPLFILTSRGCCRIQRYGWNSTHFLCESGRPGEDFWTQLPDIEHFFAALSPDPEQVIEVPKIPPLDVPMRAALRVTQLVEQLVEVPTTVSYSSLLRTVEQHVDIPSSCWWRTKFWVFMVFLPRQRSTASPSRKRISERIVEQIVDPVSRGSLPGSPPRSEFIFFSLSSWC